MTVFPNTQGPDEAPIPSAAHMALLAEREVYEHLMFEPMPQADLDGLYALYAHWIQRRGDQSIGLIRRTLCSLWIVPQDAVRCSFSIRVHAKGVLYQRKRAATPQAGRMPAKDIVRRILG